MNYFPGFLKLDGRDVLIVGGGDIALRKARLLSAAGASITAVAPEFSPSFDAFSAGQSLVRQRREFMERDLDGRWLVVTATGKGEVDREVFLAASRRQIFCNSVDDQANSSYITPAIVDRSPLVVAISSGGAAPALARSVRHKIELLLPANFGRLAELAGRWRGRVSATISSMARRRHFWDAVFGGSIQTLVNNGHDEQAERALASLLPDYAGDAVQPGKAWLVGAGPGDPDLLTVRAFQALQAADVILHDRLVSDGVLALARRDADIVSVGKTPGSGANSQEEINDRLVKLVAAGKHVCRLKGGDPFIFARGGEELEALQAAGHAVEVVPGITAAAACAAASGIPLTHRDVSQSVVFVAAHGQNSIDTLDWPSLARDRQTLVFYMAVARFSDLMNKLIEGGRGADTPIAIIERGTMPGQRVTRGHLGQLQLLKESRHISAPAILIVGEVAALGAVTVDSTVSRNVAERAQTAEICAKQVL